MKGLEPGHVVKRPPDWSMTTTELGPPSIARGAPGGAGVAMVELDPRRHVPGCHCGHMVFLIRSDYSEGRLPGDRNRLRSGYGYSEARVDKHDLIGTGTGLNRNRTLSGLPPPLSRLRIFCSSHQRSGSWGELHVHPCSGRPGVRVGTVQNLDNSCGWGSNGSLKGNKLSLKPPAPLDQRVMVRMAGTRTRTA